MKSPANTPIAIFLLLLGISGVLLLTSPIAPAWFLFFTGLYPGTIESGQPGYEFGAKIGFFAFGCFMALVYIGLQVAATLKKSAALAWVALVLLCVSGLGGCFRVIHGISQIR